MRAVQFLLFFAVFALIYFGMHYFVYWRITSGLMLSSVAKRYLLIFILLLSTSFFLSRLFSGKLYFYPFIYLGSAWFGVISISLLVFAFQWILSLLLPGQVRGLTYLSIALVGFITLFSIYSAAKGPKVKEITIPLKNLPASLNGFTILHLSDIHLGNMTPESRLALIVDRAEQTKPDLILMTGDLMDSDISNFRKYPVLLRRLKAKYGVLAVTGNHDFYVGIDNFYKLANEAGIRVLKDEKVVIADALQIVGIHDDTIKRYTGKEADLAALLKQCGPNRPIILLRHKPDGFEKAADLGVDLQLSGHTHAGQVPLFDVFVYLIFKYPYGLHHHKSSYIYTSSGTNTWGPPMRFFHRSEIVKLKLVEAP